MPKAALTIAKGTASIELVGGAERATTAKPKALEPGAYGEAGCGHKMRHVKMPLRKGKRELDALSREGEHGVDAPP